MKNLLDSLEGGTVELQKKKKITLYSLLITLTALVLTLSILLISSVVLAIKNKNEEQMGNQPAQTGVSADLIPATTALAANETRLLLLDDNHPYQGQEPVTILIKDSPNRPHNDNPNGYAYSCDTPKNPRGTAESLEAFNQMVAAFFAEKKNDNLYVFSALGSSSAPEYATGEAYELYYYVNYEISRETAPIYQPSDETGVAKLFYDWFTANAHTYGFIQLYPVVEGEINAKANIFRYVGVEHATYMQKNNLSLPQYIERLKTQTIGGRPITLSGGYKVYYIAQGEVQYMPDPARFSYTVSGDNQGGLIVTYTAKKS